MQISVGCNCRCSYCIVPSTRGREVSRPFDELVAEVERLAADGVREVTLLGPERQLLRARPAAGARGFAELLRALDAIDGLDRIRYTSPHPKDMREDVVRATPSSVASASTSTCRCSRARRGSSRRCAAPTTASATWTASR